MSEHKYEYSIRLAVKDQGERSFESRSAHHCQSEMGKYLAADVARALATMIGPPSAGQVALAMYDQAPREDLLRLIAYLYTRWDCSHDFDKAFTVTVDLDVLMPSDEDDKKAIAADAIKRLGFRAKGAPAPGG